MDSDIESIRDFIRSERAMREAVFRHDADKRRRKVGEADRALAALERIEAELARRQDLERQPFLLAWEG